MFVEGNYVFGVLKQNLATDQRVVIGRTTDPVLDGMGGTVLGKTSDNVCDTYIVLLDQPYLGQKAINITEACICPIPGDGD